MAGGVGCGNTPGGAWVGCGGRWVWVLTVVATPLISLRVEVTDGTNAVVELARRHPANATTSRNIRPVTNIETYRLCMTRVDQPTSLENASPRRLRGKAQSIILLRNQHPHPGEVHYS